MYNFWVGVYVVHIFRRPVLNDLLKPEENESGTRTYKVRRNIAYIVILLSICYFYYHLLVYIECICNYHDTKHRIFPLGCQIKTQDWVGFFFSLLAERWFAALFCCWCTLESTSHEPRSDVIRGLRTAVISHGYCLIGTDREVVRTFHAMSVECGCPRS
jgi:hypothetical protein